MMRPQTNTSGSNCSLVLQTKNGFSLIEVMVGLGLIGIVSILMTQLMSNTMKTQKGITLTDSLQNLTSIAKMNLSSAELCRHNIQFFKNATLSQRPQFQTTNLASTRLDVTRLEDNGGQAIAISGQNLPGESNTNVNLRIENLREVVANSQYTGELAFYLAKDAGGLRTVAGANNIRRAVPIKLMTTASAGTQTIVDCATYEQVALSSDQINLIKSEMCSSLNGVYTAGTGSCRLPASIYPYEGPLPHCSNKTNILLTTDGPICAPWTNDDTNN